MTDRITSTQARAQETNMNLAPPSPPPRLLAAVRELCAAAEAAGLGLSAPLLYIDTLAVGVRRVVEQHDGPVWARYLDIAEDGSRAPQLMGIATLAGPDPDQSESGPVEAV